MKRRVWMLRGWGMARQPKTERLVSRLFHGVVELRRAQGERYPRDLAFSLLAALLSLPELFQNGPGVPLNRATKVVVGL